MSTEEQPDLYKSAALPDGEYAIVELMGHRTLIGRYEEVERFGTKMIQIEPIFQSRLLPPVLHGGASIYGLTPCSKEVAADRAPKHSYSLPANIALTLPKELLADQSADRPFGDMIGDVEGNEFFAGDDA